MSLSNRLALSSGGANGANTLLSLVWMLFCVLVIVVLAYLFTKYIAGRGSAAVIASGGTEQFRVLARLPKLCDIVDGTLVFDYSSGNLRQSRIYSTRELIALAEQYKEEST